MPVNGTYQSTQYDPGLVHENNAENEHETIATLPLPRPEMTQPISEKADRRDNGHGAIHVTQPTQPLTRTRSSSPADIQVAASSPYRTSSKPSPIANGRSMINAGIAALAPPGTAFRPPAWSKPQNYVDGPDVKSPIEYSDAEDHIIDSSDDNDAIPSADIKPSSFARGIGAPTRVEESPTNAKNLSRFTFNPAAKRPVDDMASAYSTSRRPTKILRQNASAKALPVSQEEYKLEDIPDYSTRRSVEEIQSIHGGYSISQCCQALRKCGGNKARAMVWLLDQDDREQKKDAKPIDLTMSEDELTSSKLQPAVKRQVNSHRTIADKWSKNQTQTKAGELQPRRAIPLEPPSERPRDTKPRRRLVQGRRARSSSPVELSSHKSSPKNNTMMTTAKYAVRPERQSANLAVSDDGDNEHGLEFMDDDDSDSGLAPDSTPATDKDRNLIDFINECSVEDLKDMSNQPTDVVQTVIAKRPFTTLEGVESVVIKTSTTSKTGKTRVANRRVGENLLKTLTRVWEGYEAVDELVKKVDELSKPVADELKLYGFNAFGSGEISIVDLDVNAHDSGIGTPSSSVSNEDDEMQKSFGRRKKLQLLKQPENMSTDIVMKDYQVAGLNWLSLLFKKRMSCILADDMGLGKTCQVISFFAHLLQEGIPGPHLVIVPGSTLENWLREFNNFCPVLQVEPYHGGQKERAEYREQIEAGLRDGNINVIVTTYDMTKSKEDNSFLRHIRPVVCVYDEGHMLKNCKSKRYTDLMRITAQFRLLLTGTPLQNNLQELISLLSFIMPHVFSDRKDDLEYIFQHRAKTTDDDHEALLSSKRTTRARSMMAPFILRRKKHQVLKHMPKKVTRVEYCKLAPGQRELYEQEASRAKEAFLARTDASEKGKNSKNNAADPNASKPATGVLMDLRKAAIHPLLFRRHFNDKKLEVLSRACLKIEEFRSSDQQLVLEDLSVMTDFELQRFCLKYRSLSSFALSKRTRDSWIGADSSGKIGALLSILKSFSPTDRTLVFSQFTMVMDVLEEVLADANIPFCRLDGATRIADRQELIDTFNEDASIRVFMLSTRAGGTGINLAAANKVIIFDQSFNPHDDVQAENRAHRVGQTRDVEVVRLVTKGTVEELILKLGESKLVLDARVAGEGDDETQGSLKSNAKAKSQDGEDAGVARGMEMVRKMWLQDEGRNERGNDQGVNVQTGEEHANKAGESVDPEDRKIDQSKDAKDEYLAVLKAAGLNMAAAE